MATITDRLNTPPDFSRLRDLDRENYMRFFTLTAPENIENYAKGSNLTSLAELAHDCRSTIEFSCPIIDGQTQWKLNRLSEVKERLAQAVECKRRYYDETLIGIVTKYVLKFLDLFGFKKWNNGDTATIVAAEDFLLFWDSRAAVLKISHPDNPSYGKYHRRQDFPPRDLPPPFSADLSRFYNYNPRRQIELEGDRRIDYSTLAAVTARA